MLLYVCVAQCSELVMLRYCVCITTFAPTADDVEGRIFAFVVMEIGTSRGGEEVITWFNTTMHAGLSFNEDSLTGPIF